MAAEKSRIAVTLAASDRLVWQGEAVRVSVPAAEGSMGILADHEPVMAATDEGTVVVTRPDNTQLRFEVNNGFISFDSNKLTIAVERCTKEQSTATKQEA